MDELEKIKRKKLEEMMKRQDAPATPPPPSAPVTVTDDTIDATVQQYPLVLVDFWAAWCGPCKMIAPVIDAMAADYAGKVVFAKLNVDENQGSAMRFQAMSIPTLILFKDANPVDRIVGAVPRATLEARIQKFL